VSFQFRRRICYTTTRQVHVFWRQCEDCPRTGTNIRKCGMKPCSPAASLMSLHFLPCPRRPTTVLCCFYRAIHYSAKRGIEIACRPSVCLSVCDDDGSGSHTLEMLETNCIKQNIIHNKLDIITTGLNVLCLLIF